MRRWFLHMALALPIGLFGQSVLSTANSSSNSPFSNDLTTTLEVRFDPVQLLSVSSSRVVLAPSTSATAGENFAQNHLNLLTSSTQYFQYTLIAPSSTNAAVSVSLASSMDNDYLILTLLTPSFNISQYPNATLLNQNITLSTVPSNWLSFQGSASSGVGSTHGIPFHYVLKTDANGNYGSLHGGTSEAVVVFTISE